MKEWWHSLQQREQRTLLWGSVGLVLIMIYLLLIEPYQKEMARLQAALAEKRQALATMQRTAAEITALRAQGSGGQLAAGQSLMGVVDSSTKQFNIANTIKRIQPEGEHTVKVWAEQMAFDELIRWLDELQRRYGVTIHEIAIDSQEQSGRVNLRLELRGAA